MGLWRSKKQREEEEERLRQEQARQQMEQAVREKIQNKVDSDPLFQITTVDTLNWIDPYTGKIIEAPFGVQQVAIEYLFKERPWKQHPQPKSHEDLSVIRWRHFLSKNIDDEPRLKHYRDGQWLNPFTCEWVDHVPLGPNGNVTEGTLERLAAHLAACPQAQAGNMRSLSDIEEVVHGGNTSISTDDNLSESGEMTFSLENLRKQSRPEGVSTNYHMVSAEHLPHGEALQRREEERERELRDEPLVEVASVDDIEVDNEEPQPITTNRRDRPDTDSNYDLERAKSVQNKMLRDLPDLPGVEMAIYFQPHDVIGGDFYDCIALKDGRHLIVLGDVSGHGVQAALVVSATLKAMRLITKHSVDLVEILCQLNEEIIDDLLMDQFITLFAVIIDTDQMVMTCACAGHHPAVAARPMTQSYLNLVGQKGAAIGLLKPQLFRRTIHPLEFELEPGDVIMQYTDGLTEVTDEDDEEYGEFRFYGSFVAHLEHSVTDMVQGMADAAADFAGGHMDDDVSIFALRVIDPDAVEDEGPTQDDLDAL